MFVNINGSLWSEIAFIYFLIEIINIFVHIFCYLSRMKSATSKFVTCLDIFVVVGSCTSGLLSGLCATAKIKQINRKLREVDKELSLLNDESKDKKRGIILIIAVFSWITGMIILDIISRTRHIRKSSLSNNESNILIFS